MTHLHSSPYHCGSERMHLTLCRMCSIICLIISFVAMQAVAVAQESHESKVSDDAKRLKPFVSDTTILILKIDPQRIGVPDEEKALDSKLPEAKKAFNEVAKTINGYLEQLRTLADDQPIFATVGIPEFRKQVPIIFFRHKTSDSNTEKVMAFVKQQFRAEAYIANDWIVAVPVGGKRAVFTAPEDARDFRAAFKAVANYPLQLLFVPPNHVWRTIRELSPELPPQLGGGPSRVLTEGVQWASIGLDPAQLRMELVIQSASPEAARAVAAHLPTMLHSLYKETEAFHPQFPAKLAKLLIESLKPKVDGTQVKIRVDGFEKLALLAAIARVVEEKTRRHADHKQFQQILLGMHNYHGYYQMFPVADEHRDKNGKHKLSWRVHILPFIDQKPLYDQFHLNEPWDSPHNKKLIEKMPDVYARNSIVPSQAKVKPGHTTFLAPIGKKTIFGGAKATPIRQITDGTSNTIALLEVVPTRAVPWTAPADYSFDPQNPLADVLFGIDGKWLCAFADGRVSQFSRDIPPKTVLSLFQMNDGNNPIYVDQNR